MGCREKLDKWLDKHKWIYVNSKGKEYSALPISNRANEALNQKRKERREDIRELLPQTFRIFVFKFSYKSNDDKYDCIDALKESIKAFLPDCNCKKKFFTECDDEDNNLFCRRSFYLP